MQSLLKGFLHSTSNTGQFIITEFQYFMVVGQLGYVKYTFRHFMGVFSIKGSKTGICFQYEILISALPPPPPPFKHFM